MSLRLKLALVLLAVAPLALSESVGNGSFETFHVTIGNGCGDLAHCYFNSSNLPGSWAPWSFAGNSGIALKGSLVETPAGSLPDGNQFATIGDGGSISQTLGGFNIGQFYTLAFFLAPRPNYPNQTVQVNIDGASQNYALAAAPLVWALYNLSFTASTTTPLLSFSGTGGGGNALLDQVFVTPEPASMVIVPTSILLLAMLYRRRSSRQQN